MRPSLPMLQFLALLALCALARPAGAAPWFDAQDAALEDQYADGDIDEEDHEALRLATPGSSDVHGESWLSVMAYERSLLTGKHDVGGILVLGLALDRVAQGDVHRIGDPTAPETEAPAAGPRRLPALARRCVAAAWKASGLADDDARLESIAARSRASALLPETRLRAMRLWDDAAHATTLATTNDTSYYDAIGANLVLEARLTWRLDRLLYAGDEPAIERLRLERQDARARLATRTLEVLFAWERAALEEAAAATGSREEGAALLRAAEAEATLDVLTGGWFSASTGGEAGHVEGNVAP